MSIVGRRKFLKLVGSNAIATQTLLRILSAGLVEGIISKASAQTTGPSSRKLVQILFKQGVSRTQFDAILKPFSNSNFVSPTDSNGTPQNGIVTRFKDVGGSSYDVNKAEYATTSIGPRNYQLPWLWASKIPIYIGTGNPMDLANYEWIDMASLTHNLLILRHAMPLDGHGPNQLLLDAAGRYSLTGVCGSGSNSPVRPIPAVTLLNASKTYKSPDGSGAFKLDWSTQGGRRGLNAGQFRSTELDNVSQLYTDANYNTNFPPSSLDNLVQDALTALGDYAAQSDESARNLFTFRHTAESMLREGFENIQEEGSLLMAKYDALVRLCIDVAPLDGSPNPIHIAGITDRNSSCRSWFRNSPPDSSQWGNSTYFNAMTETFTVAEYLLKYNYSNVISSVIPSNVVCNLATGGDFHTDNHGATGLESFFVLSTYFRGFAACLGEFRRSMNTEWENTVVTWSSDFLRFFSGINATTSQHLWQGNVRSVLSGSIKEFLCAGNIYAQGIGPENPNHFLGTQGAAAPTNYLSGQTSLLGIHHALNTVATIAGADLPTGENNRSVVQPNSHGEFDQTSIQVESPRNV